MKADTRIPYVDIAGQHGALKDELLEAAARVFSSGCFVLGPEVEEFEREIAAKCGVPFAVGVNSGTDALVLALRVLRIGPGDEVITIPNSFVATVSAIVLVGARPVLVDVRDDFNIDPALIEAAITPRTKAILPVHLTGRPADMGPIMEIARRHRLFVIEDAAQAILAEYHGTRVGSLGDLGCFSLHPLKTLGACGDGGFVTTYNEDWMRQLKIMRNIGLETRDNAVLWSGNSRLDTLQAAFLLVKLRCLDEWTDSRRTHAALYQGRLAGLAGVRFPPEDAELKSVYHTFVIECKTRDELKAFLAEKGIGTAVHYPIPIHLQTAGRSLGYRRGDFPIAERLADGILSLPIYPALSRDDIEYVCQQVREFCHSDMRG